MPNHRAELANIKQFSQLIAYLRDEMGWPIKGGDFEELTFDFTPEELGIDLKTAAKIQEIKRLRPLSPSQPWGIFFVKFEPKKLPVVALRRILSQVAIKKRASANNSERTAWAADDLLFISNYGESGDGRQISFAHFSQAESRQDLPTLKVLGWDSRDTALHLDGVWKELTEHLAWPTNERDGSAWRDAWRSAFTVEHREVINTSKELAESLASLAGNIRDRIKTTLKIENDKGPLRTLMVGFQKSLIHDLDTDGFADMYAQTIAYGLLSARIAQPTGSSADDLAAHMRTSPFLRELMETFLKVGGRRGKAGGPGIDFDELGVSEVQDLLERANMNAILVDFGDRNQQEDPVMHFFEGFLQAYDAKIKKGRGVFYTPHPVVSYIVRSVHELLQTEFGLVDGLADTTTWGAMSKTHKDLQIPQGTSPDQAFVQILDPATGTGTFIVEVIDIIHKTMTAKWAGQNHGEKKIESLWNEYVPKHLLPRLHAYELMMAPYAIAHLKVGLKLKETGYGFGSDERARIYLTNALEPAQDFSGTFEFAIPALAHEAQAVNEVKRNQRFTVVIGNPPYSGVSQNMSGWISGLVNEYLRLPDGPMKEKSNRNHLQDDYVKFIRLAQVMVQNTGLGLVGLITNNSYFSGNWHRGMRYRLASAFPQIRLVNLHGGKGFLRSASDADENVFDIMQSVGLAFLTHGFQDTRSVFYQEIVGSRNEKYERLAVGDAGEKSVLMPSEGNQWLFQPLASEHQPEWNACASIDSVFVEWGAGVKTNRDGLATGFSRQEVQFQIQTFADLKRTDSEVEETYSFKSNYQWKTDVVRKKFAKQGFQSGLVEHYSHRPFDVRFIYWHPAIVFNMRGEKMECFRSVSPPIALLFARNTTKETYTNFFVTRWITDIHCLETMNVAPLFTGSAGASGANTLQLAIAAQPNFSRPFLTELANRMSLPVIKPHGLPRGLTPEDIFNYAYAVFHSPGYRSRYAEFLKIDFPRLPLTGNLELFRALARLGGELTALHLLESPKLDKSITEFTGGRNPEVEKISWSRNAVWVDKAQTTGFQGVREDVWNFHIGGYQVCEKWLKDRKGRKLSKEDIAHYQKIVVALSETIRLMKEIDEVIVKHGGWPGAFQTSPEIVLEKDSLVTFAKSSFDESSLFAQAPAEQTSNLQYSDSSQGENVDEVDGSNSTSIEIDDVDDQEILFQIRAVFDACRAMQREVAVKQLSLALGYERVGQRVKERLDNSIRTAVRRGVLLNDAGQLSVNCRSISDYSKEELKTQFLASLPQSTWKEREDSIRDLARWLGFRRAGPTIDERVRSIINGLIREDRLESSGNLIRR